MLPVPKGKDRSLVHPLTNRCHVNDDEWMGTRWSQGQMPWISRMEMMIIWMYRCRREQSWIHELPRPLFYHPYLLSFFLFLIFLCIIVLGSRKWEHVVYDISSYYSLKVGKFIAHQGLGCAWVPQWFGALKGPSELLPLKLAGNLKGFRKGVIARLRATMEA